MFCSIYDDPNGNCESLLKMPVEAHCAGVKSLYTEQCQDGPELFQLKVAIVRSVHPPKIAL